MKPIPEGTVIMHGHAPYDPKKAREYYLRTRKLHPRAKSTVYTVQTESGTVKVSAKELAKEKIYAAQRVNSIKTRLAKLNQELKNKLADAKTSKSESDKPKTASDKAQEAKDSKQYRDKHKTELKTKAKESEDKKTLSSGSSSTSNDKKSTHVDTADDLKVKIAAAKSNLTQAIARQRALATAKKSG